MVIKWVVDSSVIIKWLSKDNEEYLDQADKILTDAQNGNIVLIAPELAKYEVGNVLLFSKKLSSEQAKVALTQFFNIPINFIAESEESSKETYTLAFDSKITYYDTSFVALAKRENAILVTDNPKHQVKQLEVKVVPLKDY